MKYRDSIVLVHKLADGTLTRTNALVFNSLTQPKNPSVHTALKNHSGVLPEGEYLDLAFLAPLEDGVGVKATNVDQYVRVAHTVPPLKEGAVYGWEPNPVEKLKADHTYWTGVAAKTEADLREEIERLNGLLKPKK